MKTVDAPKNFSIRINFTGFTPVQMLTHCVRISAIEAITTLKEPPACHSVEFCENKNMRQSIMLLN